MSAEYDVYLLAPDSDYVLAYLGSGYSADAADTGRIRCSFSSLNYTKVVNEVGNFDITLPYPQFNTNLARLDSRLVVWRKPPGGYRYLDFAGFVRTSPRPEIYQRGSEMYCILRGFSYNHILKRREIAYAVGAAGSSHTGGVADDIMKAFVWENLGVSAGAGRDMTPYGFSMQLNTTLGTTISKDASYKNLLDTLKEISESSHSTEATCIYFGVVPLNNGWQMEFRTNRGQWGNDHRHPSGPSGVTGTQGPVVVSLARQNLDNVTLIHNRMDEVTVVYSLGQGEGTNRNIQAAWDMTRINDSPLNRIEVSINASSCDSNATVLGEANARLREGRPRRSFSASLVDVPGTIYGLHYGFGDYLTAAIEDYIFDCRVSAVTIQVADKDETITAQISEE